LLKLNDVGYISNHKKAETNTRSAMPRDAGDGGKSTKTLCTVRIDSDVLLWLKKTGKGYQTRMNAVLREAMLRSPDHGE
jgi:uncharacterized protein (DUF4415 family)